MNNNRASTMVFLCFFLSGLAGLIYEVLWIRQLSLIFGTTSFAVSTVLSAFMGGLALGSWIFGKIADRRRDPLRIYAFLEVAIGVYCLLIPLLLKAVTNVYVLTSHSMEGSFYVMSLMRFILALLVLILPTVFMGATFPVLSRYVVRSMDRLGSGVGRLYGINTFGAVIGCFAAGYLLIGTLGVWKTTIVAVILNGIVALLAWMLHRSDLPAVAPVAEETPPVAPPRAVPIVHRVLLVGIALSGFASLTYEVAWTRLLSLVLGSSVYAFSAMLTTFLLGIAFGSVVISRMADRIKSPIGAFAAIQAAVAVGVLLVTPLFDRLPGLFLILFSRIGSNFWAFQSVQFFLCLLVMFIPTFLIGTTLPLVVKAFTDRVDEVGRGVGKVYAFNTMGAIVGSFIAGFALIPLVGVQKTILAASGVNLLVGITVLFFLPRPRRVVRVLLSAAAIVLFIVLSFIGARWDRYKLNTGFFDSPSFAIHNVNQKGFQDYIYSYDIVHFEEGTYANVAVSRESGNLFLQINGRTEASTSSDMPNQILVAQIPMLIHPNPEDALLIGLGSGITLGSVVSHDVKMADCIEISPAVVRAAAWFKDWHGDVTKNPRVRMILDDGRNHLLATEKKYDVIISEPSKPWISGVSNLFTRESYENFRKRLKPGGIACQWFHYYGMSPRDFQITLRTFFSVFPYVQLWNADSNIFMLGSDEPILIDVELMERKMASESVRADLGRIKIDNAYRLLSHYVFGGEEARGYVGDGLLNTDDLPIIEFSTPRHRNSYLQDEILHSMLSEFPKFNNYPLRNNIRQVGDTIDWHMARFRFTSPIVWQKGLAGMTRNLLPKGAIENEEQLLIAYRMEVKMSGAGGEELQIGAISRAEFSEEKLKLSLERFAPDRTGSGEYSVNGHPAFWSTYRAGGRPLAAVTWFYPANRLQYIVRLAGGPSDTADALKQYLVEGATCSDFVEK